MHIPNIHIQLRLNICKIHWYFVNMLSYPINFLYSIILTCRSWFGYGYMHYTIVYVHVSYCTCIIRFQMYMFYMISLYMYMSRTLSLPWQMTSKFRIWTLLLNYQPLVNMIANDHFPTLFHMTKTSIDQCMYIEQVNI